MLRSVRIRPAPVRRALYIAVVLLMSAGQGLVASAAVLEGLRGPSTRPHVERAGVNRHYAHDEATCVACTVLAFHARATARVALASPSSPATVGTTPPGHDTRVPARPGRSCESRAPPLPVTG